MAEIIVVLSAKGGVGTSFIASNISCAMKQFAKNTLLIDYSFSCRSDDVFISSECDCINDLYDVCDNSCSPLDAVSSFDTDGVSAVINASTNKKPPEKNIFWSYALNKLKSKYNYIIIDFHLGNINEISNIFEYADKIIIVSSEEFLSIRNNAVLAQMIKQSYSGDVYLIINKASNLKTKLTVEDAIDKIGVELLGIVEFDDSAEDYVVEAKPFVLSDSVVSKELKNICARLNGEYVPLTFGTSKFYDKINLKFINK